MNTQRKRREMKSRGLWAALLCVCALGLTRPAFALSPAAGRVHAQKANKLAEQGRCAKAIPEFNKAYDILKDPAILFNRAECQRKLDHNEEALADYERFLVELPKAPNRETVQTRIDELRSKLNMPAVGLTPEKGKPANNAAPILDDADDDAAAAGAGGDKDLTWKPPAAGAAGVHLGADEAPVEEEDSGISPWLWVGLGAVVVAAGAVAAVLIVGKKDTDIPESGLGNFKF